MDDQQWLYNGARARGLSHFESGIPCQDSVLTGEKNGVYYAVLSDGCGSAHFSHYGSRYAVEATAKCLSENFDSLFEQGEDFTKRAVARAILELGKSFREQNPHLLRQYASSEEGMKEEKRNRSSEIMSHLSKEDARDLMNALLLDATILFVAIKGEKCLLGHCGDGFILGYRNGAFEVLSEEPKGEERNVTNYPSGIYYSEKAYHDPEEWNVFRVKKLNANDYLGFTLMSDGAEKSLVIPKGGDVFVPRESTNSILYEIVANEEHSQASEYLKEQLEVTYRQRKTANGDTIFITDDDVSVAILLSSLYKSEASEEASVPEEKPAAPVQVAPIETPKPSPSVPSSPSKKERAFDEEGLKREMTKKGAIPLDQKKFETFCEAYDYINEWRKTHEFKQSEVSKILSEKFGMDHYDHSNFYMYRAPKIFRLSPSGGRWHPIGFMKGKEE